MHIIDEINVRSQFSLFLAYVLVYINCVLKTLKAVPVPRKTLQSLQNLLTHSQTRGAVTEVEKQWGCYKVLPLRSPRLQ